MIHGALVSNNTINFTFLYTYCLRNGSCFGIDQFTGGARGCQCKSNRLIICKIVKDAQFSTIGSASDQMCTTLKWDRWF